MGSREEEKERNRSKKRIERQRVYGKLTEGNKIHEGSFMNIQLWCI